jgi:hypothetical protein
MKVPGIPAEDILMRNRMKKLPKDNKNLWFTPLCYLEERASIFLRGLFEVPPFFSLCIGMKEATFMNDKATIMHDIHGQQTRIPNDRKMSGHTMEVC